MSAYAVVSLTVTDRGWVREYVKNVTSIVESYEGRYLVRSSDYEQVEGANQPDTLVVLEFPTMQHLKDWYQSDEYRPYRTARQAGSDCDFYLAAGAS